MKKLLTFVLLLGLFAAAFGSQFASATDWHFGGYATATAAPTASPTPSPLFIGAVSASTPAAAPTPALPGGTQAGDCAVIVAADKSGAIAAGNWPQWANLQANFNWATGAWMDTAEKLITPADITTGHFTFTLSTTNLPYCIGVFRYVTCSNDQISANANNGGSASTAPRPSSITTTLNGNEIISVGIVNGNTGLTYTNPASYTNAAYAAPVTGVSWGCYMDYLTTPQSSAGATQPAAGTLSASNVWGAIQLALPNRGGTP